jgi:endonuclease/exonuclease/phosphatase family metal-dependent hydrolase
LLAAHLKSKVPTPEADEEEWRYQEAVALRRLVDEHLASRPEEPIIVLGDFNDVIDSKPMRALIGRGRTALFDTRPTERDGDTNGTRHVVWTDYYAKEDVYSRIDYILCSRALKKHWRRDETYVLNLADWGSASDHRPIVAGFAFPRP